MTSVMCSHSICTWCGGMVWGGVGESSMWRVHMCVEAHCDGTCIIQRVLSSVYCSVSGLQHCLQAQTEITVCNVLCILRCSSRNRYYLYIFVCMYAGSLSRYVARPLMQPLTSWPRGYRI